MNKLITKPTKQNMMTAEWLFTNGLGGFAAGTISGVPSRKQHGLLIAALSAPFGRTMLLNHVADSIQFKAGAEHPLSGLKTVECRDLLFPELTLFWLENGIPHWQYAFEEGVIEKRLLMVHGQNTLHVTYTLRHAQQSATLRWRPFFHFHTHEEPVNVRPGNQSYSVHSCGHQYEVEYLPFPPLRLCSDAQPALVLNAQTIEQVFYEIEHRRGYECVGSLTSFGYYETSLHPDVPVTFMASTESWETLSILSAEEGYLIENMRRKRLIKAAGRLAHTDMSTQLVLAADQFIITPRTRSSDIVRLQAGGEQARSIIAGYPWFTDWGRDTMISLEGLTLTTGRSIEAHAILRTFAHYIKDGLIPNLFPDGEVEGLYHTADATLWFFHAADRYIELTGDEGILEVLLPRFRHIIHAHIQGTHFGIHVDGDGLLSQGEANVQLTWMDAKVGDWVVTPRRGKAVEINALWYNALKLFERWSGEEMSITAQCYESFNRRFWYAEGQYLFDVIDGERGDDSALRPNQLFAISLPHPILAKERWKSVLEVVRRELVTPVGLRTLAPSHPDFKAQYDGDLRSRDAAYHQGTVWPWLLGAFVDSWLKVYPDRIEEARQFLKSLSLHLATTCAGTIGEIFDAMEPYHARGCFAQAWSVAEMLRCLARTAE